MKYLVVTLVVLLNIQAAIAGDETADKYPSRTARPMTCAQAQQSLEENGYIDLHDQFIGVFRSYLFSVSRCGGAPYLYVITSDTKRCPVGCPPLDSGIQHGGH